MSQVGSDSETAIGRGSRRKKLAGLLKSANELRQSYQQSYGLGPQRDVGADYDDSGIPGSFPDVAIARSGDEEMLLFPSYARRHVPRKQDHQEIPGSIRDTREPGRSDGSGYVQQEWDRYEEANSVIDVDVRGWVYSPQRGQLSRYNRAMIALARRMSGIPAPSSSRASSPNSAHHLRVEARAARHEQELVEKEAESIKRKGEGEHHVAMQGGYSEEPSRNIHQANSQSIPVGTRPPSSLGPGDLVGCKAPRPLEKSSAYKDQDDAPGPGSLAKRASWTHPSEMSSGELSIANAHMMLRLKPFLTTPLANTPLTVFFYNEKTSRSRTVYTNEAGHFHLRAALDFIPTSVRVLASEKLSATDEIHITEPHGVSLISDVDDTIKHSAIGAGAREVFRNVFIRDLADLSIDGVKEWYSKMASMGVKMHYVSNMPWQLFPVLASFSSGAGLPKGSFHLKHYTGMLQGIFEPVAERKRGTLDRIISDFPQRRFILVGDSGEADLELYTDIVEANPGRVLGVFIRDVTTKPSQGFFDPATNGERGRSAKSSSADNGFIGNRDGPKRDPEYFEPRPTLPPRQQTRSSSTLNSGPPMGKLIDFDDDEGPARPKRSMTDNEIPNAMHKLPSSPRNTMPPRPPSKPSAIRSPFQTDFQPSAIPSHIDHKPAPPIAPKPRKLSASSTHAPSERSPLSHTQTPSLSHNPTSHPTSNNPSPRPPDSDPSYSYRSAARSKISSVYNALPSLYPTDNIHSTNNPSSTRPPPPARPSSMILSPPVRSRPLRTNTTSSTSTSTTSSGAANSLSYPAAAAHYVTSHGLDGYNSSNNSVDGANDGPIRSKKEELWLQRWARAKRILEREGVVLRSWRVGGDVMGEAVTLVEKAMKEEERVKGEG